MRRYAVPLLLLVIMLAVLASQMLNDVQHDEPATDWGSVTFGALQGTLGGLTVEAAVRGLSLEGDSPYNRALREGDTWTCIIQVLALLDGVHTDLRQNEAYTSNPEEQLPAVHSGYEWHFRYEVALQRVALALERLEAASPEVRRVWREIEEAFTPLLAPRASP